MFSPPPSLAVAFVSFLASLLAPALPFHVFLGARPCPCLGNGILVSHLLAQIPLVFFPFVIQTKTNHPHPASLGAFPEQSPAGSGPGGWDTPGRQRQMLLGGLDPCPGCDDLPHCTRDGPFPSHSTHCKGAESPEHLSTPQKTPLLAAAPQEFAALLPAAVQGLSGRRQRQVNPCCVLGAGR